ncbi:MAG: DNA alkylation repair protein [Pirellulales bacterium]
MSPSRPTARKRSPIRTSKSTEAATDVAVALAWLDRHASPKVRAGMARYAIPAENAWGIAVGDLRKYARQLGRSHALAQGLWQSGWYEARMLAAFVDEPAAVTPAQMNAWAGDFDSWAICDTVCFHLFDRTPHAWKKVGPWARRRDEFVRRAAFALLASLTVHDKQAGDSLFLGGLELVERAAEDERNFVKKSVNWALRSIGKRGPALHAAAVSLAERLAASDDPAARWNGKDALRELRSAGVVKRLAAKRRSDR